MDFKVKLSTITETLLTIILLAIFFVVYQALLRDVIFESSSIKYAAIVVFASALICFCKVSAVDTLSLLGLGWFLLFLTAYTVTSDGDFEDMTTLAGYWVAALIYVGSIGGGEQLVRAVEKSLVIFCIFFALVTVLNFANEDAYSLDKGQFQGGLANANAFAGLCGMFLIFLMFYKEKPRLKIIKYSFVLLFSAFLLISASRGAILSVILVVALYYLRTGTIKGLIANFFLIGSIFALTLGLVDYSFITSREINEETGRFIILQNYLNEFSKTYMVLGTGVSLDAGRIKSELGYLDLILMAGTGALGFFLFLGRPLYFANKRTVKTWNWIELVFIYILVASLFEGYAANIASIPSIFLYLLAGLIFARHRKYFKLLRLAR